MMVGLIVDIKFAVCYFVILSVILSVWHASVSSETAERIWLKVCTKTKVCPRHYTTLRILMKINCPRGPAMGAEMFFFQVDCRHLSSHSSDGVSRWRHLFHIRSLDVSTIALIPWGRHCVSVALVFYCIKMAMHSRIHLQRSV